MAGKDSQQKVNGIMMFSELGYKYNLTDVVDLLEFINFLI